MEQGKAQEKQRPAMARSLYLRLALAVVAAVPTTLLYLSTVLDVPFHLLLLAPSGGHANYGDEAATVAIDEVLYKACAAYAVGCLVFWTWMLSQQQLTRQLTNLPGLGAQAAAQLTFFFLGVLPTVLLAVQVVQDSARYHDLFVAGHVTLNAVLDVAFDALVAFTACAQAWLGTAVQLQLRCFEEGQDRQRYTRKIYFFYTPTSLAPWTPATATDGKQASDDQSEKAGLLDEEQNKTKKSNTEEDNRAQKKAYEMSQDAAYSGFTKSVMVLRVCMLSLRSRSLIFTLESVH